MTAPAAFPIGPNLQDGKFKCEWGPRRESALQIAARLHELNRRLAIVEPEHREIWPLFAARAIRPGRDPGPLLDMTVEELGDLIDRRARFDPPRFPAPVDGSGYALVATVTRIGLDPLDVSISLHVGSTKYRNEARVDYNDQSWIWRDGGACLLVIQALVEAMEPEWACAVGVLDEEAEGDPADEFAPYSRPWLAWTAPGAELPHWIRPTFPPAEVRAAFGGELRIWS